MYNSNIKQKTIWNFLILSYTWQRWQKIQYCRNPRCCTCVSRSSWRTHPTVCCQWRWWGWRGSTGLPGDTLCCLPWYCSRCACSAGLSQWECDRGCIADSLSRPALGLSRVGFDCVMPCGIVKTLEASQEMNKGTPAGWQTGKCIGKWTV